MDHLFFFDLLTFRSSLAQQVFIFGRHNGGTVRYWDMGVRRRSVESGKGLVQRWVERSE